MKKLLPLLLLCASPAFAQTSPPASNLDGDWHGRSDNGSCGAPLDYQISIDTGIVDGSAYDTSAHGPVPNLKKSAPPAPTPGLWMINGVVKGNSFSLMAIASVRSEDRRSSKFSVAVQGASLVVTEQGSCGRRATLTR
jgi:hypothetical protein